MATSPLSPSDLIATPGTSSIHLAWTNNDYYSNAINIMRKPEGGSYSNIGSVYYPTAEFTDTTARECVHYYYYVTTTGTDEFGNPYGPSNTEDTARILPRPLTLVATPVEDDDSIDLAWDNSTTAPGYVRVRWRKDGTGTWTSNSIGMTASANVDDLDEASLYEFDVAYYCAAAGYGTAATAATARVNLIAPTNLSCQGSTADQTEIDLAWEDNSGHEAYYEIYQDDATAGTAGSGATTYAATGLTPAQRYVFKVRARVGAYASEWSNTASAVAGYPPDPPTLNSVTPDGSYEMDLNWTMTGSDHLGFYVYRSEDGIEYDYITGATAGATGIHDEGLDSYTYYKYLVASWNNSGEVDSNATGATTDNDTEAPTGLALEVISDSQIRLRFSNNSDDVDYHKVRYRKSTEAYGSTDQTTITAPATGCIQGNLQGNTKYYFKVRDLFGAEYSSFGTETGATTLESGTPSTRRNETYFAFGNELCLTTDEQQGVRDIDRVWTSKPTDFSEQDPEAFGKYKTVERIVLEYQDVDEDTPVIVSVSADNGLNWTDAQAQGTNITDVDGFFLIGDGDNSAKSADFWFAPFASKYFQVRVRSVSASKSFIWTGLYIYYRIHGPYAEAV